MAMNRNRFKYSKPKSKPESQGYWIEARKGDPDNYKLVTSVIETCLNERALWQNYLIASTSLYINTDLEQKFSDKEKELEGILKEKPPQMFAFGLVRTKAQADEIVNKSAYFRHIFHVPLGDPSKGVNLVKHADVLMTFAAKKRCQRPWLIVYRVMVGRSKNVKPRFVSQAPQVNPTPNADSHVCKDINTKSNLALEQLNQSQIFLYELNNQGRPIKHPRHCLPYAVISWKQRDVPLSLTPNPTESRKKVNAAKKAAGGNDSGVPQLNPAIEEKRLRKEALGEEEVALSRLLDDESLTLEDLNSTQLDSKLDDIKKEREAVMAKLKAIQNIREQLTSGSCSSESEQEIDKTLDKITGKSGQAEMKIAQSLSGNGTDKTTGKPAQMDRKVVRGVSTSSPDKITGKSAQVDRKIIRSMSSSGPDTNKAEMERREMSGPFSQDGNQFGRSNSLDTRRQERIASTSGWRDPYHWTPGPYERNPCDEMYGGGGGFDYYQNDEQADMFDLEEMLYAGKIPQKAPARVHPPAPMFNQNNAPDRFHDDIVQVPNSEGKGSVESGDELNGRPQIDGHNNKIETEISRDDDSVDSNNSRSTFNKDVVPETDISCQNYNGREVESSAASGDNQLSSNIQVRISTESGCNPNGSAFHQGIAPTSDASLQNHNTMPDIKSNLVGGDQSYSKMDVGGGDTQLSSDVQVQDMDIDESSRSSNSCGSSQINPIATRTYQAVNPPPPAAFTSQSFPAVYASQSCNNSYNINTTPSSYTNSTVSSIPVPISVPPPSLPYNNVAPTNSTASSAPAIGGVLPLSLTYKTVARTNPTVSSIPAPVGLPPPSLPYNNVAATNSTASSIPVPVGVPPPSLPYNNVAFTNSTVSSIPAPAMPVSVPPLLLPYNNVAPISEPVGVPPPSLLYNNVAPIVTQNYNSFNFEGAPTSSNVPPTQYSTQEPEPANSDPLGLLGASYQPPPYSTPTSSTDTPRSDFSAGKVVSRDATGRLRLLSQSESPVEAPKVVFVKPPSPPSGEQGAESESNSKLENAATALSAIDALQKQMVNSNNPNQTKAHALQMIMNTLLTKMVATQKANATKAATSSSQGDVQSKLGLTEKVSPDVVPKPVKMFHGRPLIRKGAKKPPRPILLEQLSDEPKPVDPRPARSSIFGRKFEVSLDAVPWAKTVCVSPNMKVTKITKIDQDGTQMQTQLRDPRLRKQIVTEAPAAVASVPKKVVKPQPTADTKREEVKSQQKSTTIKETSHKDTNKQAEKSLNTSGDTEIEVLGKYRSYGRETPKSGELSDSATDDDVRTVVVQRNRLESQKSRYENMCEPGEAKQHNIILNKFKYVQNLNASIPDENTERKVKILPQPQDTVFDRLGTKRKRRSDDDLRNKITGKKSDVLTGYAVRDQFLISESGNDSSVMEVKSWSPPLPVPSTSTESFADSFKWYDRKPEDGAVAPLPTDDKYRKRRQNSGDRHAHFWDNEHEKWREQQLQGMNWTDGMDRERNDFHGEWDQSQADRSRLLDNEFWQRDQRRRQNHYGDGNRDTYQREHGYPNGPSTLDTFGQPQSWQRNQSRPTSPARSDRSLSKDRSSRSHQRHSISDTRSSRVSAKEERLQTWSSTGSYPTDRSLDRLSRSSQQSRSRDRASVRSGSSMSSISLESGLRNGKDRTRASPISWDSIRRPPSRGSSNNSPRETNATRLGLLDERLEKEHGIAPSKKCKLGTDSVPDISGSIGCEQQKVDGSVMYRNLCSSLAALKQSVTKAARSFKDLTRHELKAKVDRYQERYKKLQDTAIKALEVHYEQDREPSELDRGIQQRLLEMITDIESQREGLEKYKTSSDGRSIDSRSSRTSKHRNDRRGDDVRDKSVSSRSSSDRASQMYDRRQTKKYSTYSPVRSNSGSTQKKRCP